MLRRRYAWRARKLQRCQLDPVRDLSKVQGVGGIGGRDGALLCGRGNALGEGSGCVGHNEMQGGEERVGNRGDGGSDGEPELIVIPEVTVRQQVGSCPN